MNRAWTIAAACFISLGGGCATDSLPPPENRPPVAEIDVSETVEVGATVQLDASPSEDPDGDSLTYEWVLATPNGSTATLDSTVGEATLFVADVPGEFGVTLTVTDGKLQGQSTAVITAGGTPENRPPIAIVGEGVTVEVGTPVTLDGTQSNDPDDDPLFFDWVMGERPQGSEAKLTDPYSPTPAVTPDVPGDYRIRLTVSDGQVDSEPVVTTIKATAPANQPPVADAGRDIAVATGDPVTLDATESSDPEGASLTFSWDLVDQPPSSTTTLSDAGAAQPTLTPDVDGTYLVELIVSDGELTSEPDTVTVTAATGNVPPNANAGPDQMVEVGDVVQLDGTGSDDNEDDTLTYDWKFKSRPATSNAQLDDPSSPAPSFTADAEGDYIVELTVNDGMTDSTADTVDITAVDPNETPTALAGADQQGRVGVEVVLDGSNSDDPDGDSLTYEWSWVFKPNSSNATLQDKTTALASFTPDVAGTYTVNLSVSDGSDSMDDMITVTVLEAFPQVEGDVVITEMMPNPDVLSDTDGEWFEIYNPTDTTWNLRDCTLEDLDSDSHTIDQSLVVAPMTYVTLARKSDPGFGPDYVYGNELVLGNTGDELLIHCDGTEVAQVAVHDTFGFSLPVTAGKSLSLLRGSDETDNDDGANWCESTTDYNGDFGTPGAPNEYQNACP